MGLARVLRIAVALFAVAFGLLTLTTARANPGGSFAGTSTLGWIAELGAGWGLVAVGLLFWSRHSRNNVGPLLAAAGLAWFLPEWSNQGVGTALGFTVGLVGIVACPPLVAHAALAYPTGHLASWLQRAVLAVSYAGALLLLGLLPTAVFDPRQTGCQQCPRNLVLTDGDLGLYNSFYHYGLRLAIGWVCALGALLILQIVRSSKTTLVTRAPTVLAALAYLTFVAWNLRHSLTQDILGNDSFAVGLWRYEAAALVTLSATVAWGLFRERQARSSVARLVVELGQAPRLGGVREALAQALADPKLELAYLRPDSDLYIDAHGQPINIDAGPGQTVTILRRRNTPVAGIVHDARLLDRPGLIEEVLSAARLAVENEQLQAEVQAQLVDLRASRARIVEMGDDERRRLERDLHDGAQQRIVALSLGIQLLRSRRESAQLDTAADELHHALGELRELAHGIYPAALADDGLAAAIEALAERSTVPLRIETLTEERFPEPVENAAYFTVAEAVKGACAATIRVERSNDRLFVRVERQTDGADPDNQARLIEMGDRVGALDGRLESDETHVHAEIPCA